MNSYMSKYLLYYPATLLRGERVFRHLTEYVDNQYLPREELYREGLNRLAKILRYSARFCPYYREVLQHQALSTQDSHKIILDNVPLLDKKTLIANRDAIKSEKSRFASEKTTGGSTGEPVKLYKNPEALARERAATWRAYQWAGVKIGDKQARFWGVHHNRTISTKARLIDFITNRYRISAFHSEEEQLKRYYEKLVQVQPVYLYGYVSALLTITKYAESAGYRPVESVFSIITTAEILTNSARRCIEGFWGVKVFNEYGCGEVGSIAHECEYGRMHVMADNLHLEILDREGNQASTGEVVLTDYHNEAMPLIRYRVGDHASLSTASCPCGRTLPILENIHGRVYDFIRTPSGRDLHPEALVYIFEDLQTKYSAFSQFQIVQSHIDCLDIRIVPTSSWRNDLTTLISKTITANIDADLKCKFSLVDSVERERSGKVRIVKSTMSNPVYRPV